jgi:glycosyltransferase involved in cell wall biosynthesis
MLVAPEKIAVVKNGVDVSHFQDLRRESDRSALCRVWGFPDDSVIVATVGELNPLKGHDLFLRAASVVVKKFGRARFVIAGGDHSFKRETKTYLEALISEFQLRDHVRLLGEVSDVGPVLAGVDVFVSASRTESFGLAIVEAMAAGIPVIATATEGAREVVREGDTGFIVPLDQAEEMSAAVLKLLTNPEERNRMGQLASKCAAEQFSLDRMIGAVEQIYLESLEASH